MIRAIIVTIVWLLDGCPTASGGGYVPPPHSQEHPSVESMNALGWTDAGVVEVLPDGSTRPFRGDAP